MGLERRAETGSKTQRVESRGTDVMTNLEPVKHGGAALHLGNASDRHSPARQVYPRPATDRARITGYLVAAINLRCSRLTSGWVRFHRNGYYIIRQDDYI
jgi:hypothetical protein